MKKVNTKSLQTKQATERVEAMHMHRQASASLFELTPAQCQVIAPEQFAHWTSVELEALSDEAVDSLSAEQVAALCTAGIEGLSQDEGQALTTSPQDKPSTALGQTARQTHVAPVVPHEELIHWGPNEWAALTPAQFALLTPTQVASLSGADVQALSDEVIDSLSAEQVEALSTSGIRGLSSAQLDALSEQDTDNEAESLQADEKAKLSRAQMAAIGTVALAALGSACLAAWHVAEVPSFSSAQPGAPINKAVGTAMQTWGQSPAADIQRRWANAQTNQPKAHLVPVQHVQAGWSQRWALANKTANGTFAREAW
jgi:hypothetical protein